MDIVIMKFGGFSLSCKKNRQQIIKTIKSESHRRIILVVSAPGRCDSYSTDTLLNMVTNLTKKEQDYFISIGEVISGHLLKNDLLEAGLDSVILKNEQIGIITDDKYGDAQMIELDPTKIKLLLEKNKILIVPGFQGTTIDGDITTLSRGGGDLTAVYLAKMLEVEQVYLYKDVDGVFVMKPGLINSNTLLNNLSYQEMLNVSKYNSQIIQKKAIEFASNNKIEICIINFFTNCFGTLISSVESGKRLIGIVKNNNQMILIGNFIAEDYQDVIWKLNNSLITYQSIDYNSNYILIEFNKLEDDYLEIFHNYL